MAAVTSNRNQARARRVAVKRVEGFAKQFGEAHRNLARHAAFPLSLTPDLLYQIWANFVPEAPWEAVAHLLLSRLCRQVGYEMYEMDISDRNLLLRELKEQFGQERLDELAEFLLDYVAQRLTDDDPDTQDLAEAQEWTALAYTKPNELARELAEALSARVKQEDMAEVFRLASLVETFAEPLAEAGFEPLLVYSRGIENFARGNFVAATTEFNKVSRGSKQLKVAGIHLPIFKQTLGKKYKPPNTASPNNQLIEVKLVVLKLGDGNFNEGFPVTLQISTEKSLICEIVGILPPAPEIPELYKHWLTAYHSLGMVERSQISSDQNIPNNIAASLNNLRLGLNTWLNSKSFSYMRNVMREYLTPSDEVRFFLQAKNYLLQRLPWQVWDFFEKYPKAELALITPVHQDKIETSIHSRKQVRILAILGDSTGMDLDKDRRILEKLPNTELTVLVAPQREQLDTQLRDEQGWDILFFAGQSSSQPRGGNLYINNSQILTIVDLEKSLTPVVKGGLRLVIFNSCDSLGLGIELVKLHIPIVIAMGAPVPDRVAQEFLQYFFNAFLSGHSLYAAVRVARERLRTLEDQFTGASLLPVIIQNLNLAAPTWEGLLNREILAFPSFKDRGKKPKNKNQLQPINLNQWFSYVFDDDWKAVEDIFDARNRESISGFENDVLAQIGQGSTDAITTLIELLHTSQDQELRYKAAVSLGQIGQGNADAITTLTELLHTSQDQELRYRAAVSLGKIDPGNLQAGVERAKRINLGIPPDENQIILVITLIPDADNRIGIRAQVHPADNQTYLPPNMKLILLDENGTTRMEFQSESSNNLVQFLFSVIEEHKFSVKLVLGDFSVMEHFVISGLIKNGSIPILRPDFIRVY